MNFTPRTGTKHFTASALIENRGRFLVQFHQKLGLWLYPGGHIEDNEEPHEAMLREVAEEVGVTVSFVSKERESDLAPFLPNDSVVELPAPLATLCERIAARKDQPEHWHIDLIYHCRMDDGVRQNLEESEFMQWVTPDEADAIPCPPELPALMRRAQRLGRA